MSSPSSGNEAEKNERKIEAALKPVKIEKKKQRAKGLPPPNKWNHQFLQAFIAGGEKDLAQRKPVAQPAIEVSGYKNKPSALRIVSKRASECCRISSAACTRKTSRD